MANTLAKARGLVLDYLFDARYGVDTCACLELDHLTVEGENKDRGYLYQPTRVVLLRKLFRALRPLIAPESVLVDFGSGKGRILLVAAEFGFRKVRGVEFAHELCEIARRNISRFTARIKGTTEFKICELDAAKYVVEADETVFIMSNPFDQAILTKVLDNLVASLRRNPRQVLIAYFNAKWDQAIQERAEFVRLQELDLSGFRVTVYSNRERRPA
jgi:hypothetical protein